MRRSLRRWSGPRIPELRANGQLDLGPWQQAFYTEFDGNVVEFWTQDMAQYSAGARAGGEAGTFRRPE
jgi:hypothetical protein